MNKGTDIKKDVILNTTSVFIYFFVQWVLTVIVTRAFDFENAGMFTLAVSFSNIFCYISNFGVRNVQISDSKRRIDRNSYISFRIVTSIISVFLFAIAIITVRYNTKAVMCCIAMMLYKLLESYSDVMLGEMQVIDRYDWIAVSYLLKSVNVFVFFVAGIILGMPLFQCIYAMCIGYSIVLLCFDFGKLHIYRSFEWKTDNYIVLIRRCFPLTVMSILDALILYVPKHYVEVLFGSELLGYYGTITIVIVVMSTLGSAVWSSLIPAYSKSFDNNDEMYVLKMTKIIVCVLLSLALILLTIGRVVAPFFYKLIFGEGIMKHMYLLASVIINSLLLLYNSYFLCFLIPLKKNQVLPFADAIALIAQIPFTIHLCSKIGMLGASYGLTMALGVKFLILLCQSILSMRKRLKKYNERGEL